MSLHTITPEIVPTPYYWVAVGNCPNCVNGEYSAEVHHDCARTFFHNLTGVYTYEIYYCECGVCFSNVFRHYFKPNQIDTICSNCKQGKHPEWRAVK